MSYWIALAHERFPPDDLLRQAVKAEQAGFDGIWCSDHLASQIIAASDPDEHVKRIELPERLGATTIVLMNVSGDDPHAAIRVYAESVLPELR